MKGDLSKTIVKHIMLVLQGYSINVIDRVWDVSRHVSDSDV